MTTANDTIGRAVRDLLVALGVDPDAPLDIALNEPTPEPDPWPTADKRLIAEIARCPDPRDEKLFTKLHAILAEIQGAAAAGDIDSLSSALEDMSARLGELQDFVDYANEVLQ